MHHVFFCLLTYILRYAIDAREGFHARFGVSMARFRASAPDYYKYLTSM